MAVVEYQKKTNRVYSEFGCHCHSVYEIYYFIDGDADIMIEGKVYALTPHTLILLAPGVMHGIQVNSDVDYIRDVIYITTKDMMPERFHTLTSIVPDLKKTPSEVFIYEKTHAYHLDQFFFNINRLKEEPQDMKAMFEPVFIEALIAQINLLCRNLKSSTANYKTDSRITEIVKYINAHLTEHMSLNMLSEKFFLSKNYLNKLFKQYLGTTVNEYIRYKRVVVARQHMIQDGENAMTAAMNVGFTDYSSFYRTYTKYIKSSPHDLQIM